MPSSFPRDFVAPRISLPLFRLHYCLYRTWILNIRSYVDILKAEQEPLDPTRQETMRSVVEAARSRVLAFGSWTAASDAIAHRTSFDAVYLESLVKLAFAALLHFTWKETQPEDSLFTAEVVFCTTVPAIQQIVAMNPTPWVKYQKERYTANNVKGPVWVLRQLAVQVFPGLPKNTARLAKNPTFQQARKMAITTMSYLLGEHAILDEKTGTFTFKPLPEQLTKIPTTLSEY